jgi:heme-degrading monooxygenase HmoA
MYVAIIDFPAIKPGRDAEFQEWFSWSNKEFAKHKGFIKRILLKPAKDGNYVAIMEHESQETFMAMHSSPEHAEAGKRVTPLFDGSPSPRFYTAIIGQSRV